MAASPIRSEGLRIASTFLSHSSHSSGEKELVREVAKQLARRGVLAWLDEQELGLSPLSEALTQAVQAQATMAIFLSEHALNSEWCKDELRWALESAEGIDHLLPVYLGDPLELVRRHPVLRTRFLHPDGDRVNLLGCWNPSDPLHPDPQLIAKKIAQTVFKRVFPPAWSEVVVIVDQRGAGPRRQPPRLPDNVARLEVPALRFQVDLEPRQRQSMVTGSDWEHAAQCMKWGLSIALGSLRGEPRKVRVVAEAQTSLAWAVGSHFDRTTSVELYAYDKQHVAITNRGQVSNRPLEGGNPCAAQPVPQDSPVSAGSHAMIALGVGPFERYSHFVKDSLAPNTPLFWIDPGNIENSEQAMNVVADLVAAASHLTREHRAQELLLYWSSANHLACLAAANLTHHVVPRVRFMERDHTRCVYEYLPMP